ncbi:hypothetical protein K7432_012488 [Basidiobolus ranarum]|uniref:Secreted protein n=1 Tax=Basidiobolus ranarum TaxID=34480 RepID=A0ABR2WKR2_9FUNG
MHIFKVLGLLAVISSGVNSMPVDINSIPAPTAGNVGVSLSLVGSNEITAVDVIMVVPSQPTTNAGSFLAWAGIQSTEGSNILRSVFSYSSSCSTAAATTPGTPVVYPEYTDGNMNCQGTTSLAVSTTQEIYVQFRKSNNVWNLFVTNMATSETATMSVDLQNVPQQIASLGLRIPDGMSSSGDMTFKNWVIQSSLPDPNLCQNLVFSHNTICSASQVYEGNLQCALTNCVVKLT